ncbi:MAG: inorganic phosphate transporter [Rikenellaceae bacterium]|jgi:phosphate/sulfate permease|nr:inorganic phosphate transporter [Rikenellaceae bacterium]
MELIYSAVVIILGITAVSGLFVGVTNDAVNFLNSAIGSKVATLKVILAVASVGIVVGTLTSSGMMEVARSGMFNPEMFTFREVMMLYLAVMLGNIVLLDIYNSLGLPTSTTVSLIFALLGSAIAVSVVKISDNPAVTISNLGEYINSARALGIVSAILLSVAISFVVGTAVMYLSRLFFSFRYARIFRRWGAVWCGIALTSILYFVLIKGLKGPLQGTEFMDFVNTHKALTFFGLWVATSALLLGLQRAKTNILKLTILAGTFALALAFAGNDLVNFIGVPIAGFDSYKMAAASGNMDMTMEGLRSDVPANFLFLVGAGIIMIVTLWTSKKAMHVTETEINLASQNEEQERYGSTAFSRSIVRAAVGMNNGYKRTFPHKTQEWINRRFEPLTAAERGNAQYDLIRATVNLTCSALLIALATSLKLPLSTTYVCFMVAMGTSLADRAWGRESAVYRISGVMTVIAGWFITGLGAFVIAFTIGIALMYGGTIAIIAISALALYLIVRSNFQNKKKGTEAEEDKTNWIDTSNDSREIIQLLGGEVRDVMDKVTKIYDRTLLAIMKENRRTLREMVKESNDLFYQARERKYAMMPILLKLQGYDIETSHYYVQVVDYLSEVTKALVHITRPGFDHIDNNHEGFSKEQVKDLMVVSDKVKEIYGKINVMLQTGDFGEMNRVMQMRDELMETINDVIKNQLRRIADHAGSTKASVLYLNILNETKTMVLQSRNLLKSQKHFFAATTHENNG